MSQARLAIPPLLLHQAALTADFRLLSDDGHQFRYVQQARGRYHPERACTECSVNLAEVGSRVVSDRAFDLPRRSQPRPLLPGISCLAKPRLSADGLIFCSPGVQHPPLTLSSLSQLFQAFIGPSHSFQEANSLTDRPALLESPSSLCYIPFHKSKIT